MKNLYGLRLLWKLKYTVVSWESYLGTVYVGDKRRRALWESQIWCLLMVGPAEEAESGSAMHLVRKSRHCEPVFSFPPACIAATEINSPVKRRED